MNSCCVDPDVGRSASTYWIDGEWKHVERCAICGKLGYQGKWHTTWHKMNLLQLSPSGTQVNFPYGKVQSIDEFMKGTGKAVQDLGKGASMLQNMTFTVTVGTLREAASAKAETLREEEKAAAAELDALRKKQDEQVQQECGQYRRSTAPQDAYNSDEDKLINKAETLCNKAAGLEHWVDLLGVEEDTVEKEVDRADLEYLGVVEEFPKKA